MNIKPINDGKIRLRLYNIAIATGLSKESAAIYADFSGVNLQRITKIYDKK